MEKFKNWKTASHVGESGVQITAKASEESNEASSDQLISSAEIDSERLRNEDSPEFQEMLKDSIHGLLKERSDLEQSVKLIFGGNMLTASKETGWLKNSTRNFFLHGLIELQTEGKLSTDSARALEMLASYRVRGIFNGFDYEDNPNKNKVGNALDDLKGRKYIKALNQLKGVPE